METFETLRETSLFSLPMDEFAVPAKFILFVSIAAHRSVVLVQL